MIIVRLLFVGFIIYLLVLLQQLQESSNFTSSGSYSLNGVILIIAVIVIVDMFLVFAMTGTWHAFGKANNLKQLPLDQEVAILTIPSFMGHKLRWSGGALEGARNGYQFVIFTRAYKEGGVVRWRERKIDTVIHVRLNRQLPHMIVDSRYADKLRATNLTKRYQNEQLIQFEGSIGDKYYAYTASENRILLLQLFTPDVLEVLFEKMPDVDIEIQGDSLWFVHRHGVPGEQETARFFGAVDRFMSEFEKQQRIATFDTKQYAAPIKSSIL